MSQVERLVIYPSLTKLLLVFFGALAFVAMGVVLLLNQKAFGADGFTVAIGSYIGIPFFGFCSLWALMRLFVPRPAIVVDETGIVDNSSALSVGLLLWDEINELVAYNFMNQRFLGIVPRDIDDVIRRQNFAKRILLRANQKMAAAAINIPETALPISADELLQQIVDFKTRHVPMESVDV